MFNQAHCAKGNGINHSSNRDLFVKLNPRENSFNNHNCVDRRAHAIGDILNSSKEQIYRV
jgi:hypothetical protein